MEQQLKQKWVEMLESGEYPQGAGQLKTSTGYCCLGVLCLAAGFSITGDGEYIVGKEDEGYGPFRELGLEGTDLHTLYKMNDIQGKTFLEIAEYIKTNL